MVICLNVFVVAIQAEIYIYCYIVIQYYSRISTFPRCSSRFFVKGILNLKPCFLDGGEFLIPGDGEKIEK